MGLKMRTVIFLLFLVFLQACSTQKPYWETKIPIKSSKVTIWESVDTLYKGETAFIFVKTRQIDSIWYEDSTKLRKLRNDIDSIEKATYLVTSDMTRFQQKQQKGYEFYKGVSCVTATVLIVTGIWWIFNGRQ